MTEPTCAITGDIAGHPFACGDCDPCFAARHVSPEVKRLLAETVEWMRKYEDACGERDMVVAAAEAVCWFDWSDNDEDAVRAIHKLRSAIRGQASNDDP